MNGIASDFPLLMQRLEAGDAGAFATLYAKYGDDIRRAVRQQLHARLRPQFDSIDFVHDVWASFVAMPAGKQAFADPEALGKFLSRIARNKVIEVFRQRFGTRRCDIRREQPLLPAAGNGPSVADHGPSPSQVAMAGERLDEMARTIPAGHRAILDRLREGHTHEEVAAKLGISVRTVERVVRRLREIGGA